MKWNGFRLALLTVALLVQTSPVQPRAWVLEDNGLAAFRLSGGLVPGAQTTEADIDMDGEADMVSLTGSHARITSRGESAWQSPENWRVMQAQFTDLNHDGEVELALLVWRPFRDWPVDQWLAEGGRISKFHDERGDSCHLILIGWKNGQFREMWAGSALAEPVKSFQAFDLNGDGVEELITLEGLYSDPPSAPARFLKVWEWNGFGFSNVSNMDGRFSSLSVAYSDEGRPLILLP